MAQIKLYRTVIALLVVMIIVLAAMAAGSRGAGIAYAQNNGGTWGKYQMDHRVLGDGSAVFYVLNTQTGEIHAKDQSDKLLFIVTYAQ